MGEVFPGVSVGAVVLADRAPGALAYIWTPAVPMGAAGPRVFETAFFVCHGNVLYRA